MPGAFEFAGSAAVFRKAKWKSAPCRRAGFPVSISWGILVLHSVSGVWDEHQRLKRRRLSERMLDHIRPASVQRILGAPQTPCVERAIRAWCRAYVGREEQGGRVGAFGA